MLTMIGQGRPTLWPLVLGVFTALGLVLLRPTFGDIFSPAHPEKTAGASTLRIRISWGGGSPGAMRQWSGVVSLSSGSLSDHTLLGIESDDPGSMWIDRGQLRVQQRSPRAYDGVDVSVDAPPDAVLTIKLSTADDAEEIAPIEISLRDLTSGFYSGSLDKQGNRLFVRRTPGDLLHVEMDHHSLVFSPGEKIQLRVRPHMLSAKPGSPLQLKAELLAAREGSSLWSADYETAVAAPEEIQQPVTVDVTAPEAEGVYDVRLVASPRAALWGRPWAKPIAERRVQFVVVSDKKPSQTTVQPWTEVGVIDPANPKWWERLQLSRIPGLQRAPLGSGNSSTWQHPLGQMMQVGPGGQGESIGWEAYTLPVSKIGLPHLVEVEYPSDVSQTLGISIIEPDAAGAITPIGLDSGFYAGPEVVAEETGWRKHRLLFWPHTKTPLILLTNRRDGSRATYGKIRVFAGPRTLPPLMTDAQAEHGRMLGAFMSRPLFAENFTASETLDKLNGRSLHDWQTFYEGATRLVDYLKYTGQNGLMMNIYAEGSSIYPSRLVEPTPKFDTGVFLDSASDPQRKDIAELIFRLCDREGMHFIPAVQFSTPLPRLEAILRSEEDSTGIELIGADGRPWSEGRTHFLGTGAFYNPLNETVQDAMVAVAQEIVDRYSAHKSFSGIAIELSSNSFAQFPSESWALDDATIARFSQEMDISVPFTGPGRFAERAQAFAPSGPLRDTWLQWRAKTLASLHHRLAAVVKKARPEAILYLAGTEMFDDPLVERDIRRVLPPGRVRFEDISIRTGIKPEYYGGDSGVELLRSYRQRPPASLASEATDLHLNNAAEFDRQLKSLAFSASLHVHEPQKARLESFDRKSPFGAEKTYTWLVSEFLPSGAANRRRFVHSVAALDSLAIFDGGWLLPLGQEESVRDFALAYRQLPAVRFEDVSGTSMPVVVRKTVHGQHTYVYLVNDSVWRTEISMQVAMPVGCAIEELSGMRKLTPPNNGVWTVHLEPYDFVAVRFDSGVVTIQEPVPQWSDSLRDHLTAQVRDLGARVASLANAAPLPTVLNNGFEQPSIGNSIPGWQVSAAEGATAQLDPNGGAAGSVTSVRLTSAGPSLAIRSEPFESPKTGRMEIRVTLRTQEPAKQPAVRIRLDGALHGRPYSKVGEIRAGSIAQNWTIYPFAIDDVPADGLTDLMVGVELAGAGEVWVDNIQVYDLKFLHDKHRELIKIVAAADSQLTAGNLGDCMRMLDGYWPRFLQANVPLTQLPVVESKARPQPPAAQPEKAAERPGMLNRIKGMFRF